MDFLQVMTSGPQNDWQTENGSSQPKVGKDFWADVKSKTNQISPALLVQQEAEELVIFPISKKFYGLSKQIPD